MELEIIGDRGDFMRNPLPMIASIHAVPVSLAKTHPRAASSLAPSTHVLHGQIHDRVVSRNRPPLAVSCKTIGLEVHPR